ncbi:MAG: ClpXP protease specificity-enhancing factor [Pseudohongiellaceae bacterium]
MSVSRPYLVRALYEWILDNACTPYILVNAMADGVAVPQEHVKDGQIILNISPSAVNGLQLGNEAIYFDGRFAGIPTRVHVPILAVLGIYAKENGQGMFFEFESPQPAPPTPSPVVSVPGNKTRSKTKPGKPPSLRVVK